MALAVFALGTLPLLPGSGGGATADETRPQVSLPADARLDRPISLWVPRLSLTELASELSSKGGVKLVATPELDDEFAAVFCNDRPLREVMEQLAHQFGCRWVREGGEGAATYRMLPPSGPELDPMARGRATLVTAVRAEVGRLRALRGVDPEVLKTEADGYDREFSRIRSLPPADQTAFYRTNEGKSLLARTPETTRRRRMADPAFRSLVECSALLSDADWQRLERGVTVLLALQPRSGARMLPRQLAEELRKAGASRAPSGATPQQTRQREADAWTQAADLWVALRLALDPMGPVGRGTLSFGLFPILPGGSGPSRSLVFTVDVFDPLSAPIRPPSGSIAPSAAKAFAPPGPPGGADASTVGWFTRMLPSLAETYQLQLVADAYRTQRAPLAPPAAMMDLVADQALNRYVLPEADWVRDGSFVRIRRRDFTRLRLREIPTALAARLAKRATGVGMMPVDAAAEVVASLRDAQLEHLVPALAEQGVRVIAPNGWVRSVEALRCYAALRAEQRQALAAAQSLPITALSATARRHLDAVLLGRFEEFPRLMLQSAPGRIAMSVRRSGPGPTGGEVGELRATLTYRLDDGHKIDFDLQIPLFHRLPAAAPQE